MAPMCTTNALDKALLGCFCLFLITSACGRPGRSPADSSGDSGLALDERGPGALSDPAASTGGCTAGAYVPLTELVDAAAAHTLPSDEEEEFDAWEDEDGHTWGLGDGASVTTPDGQTVEAAQYSYVSFVKPVSVRDYDGSYAGVWGTGSFGYGTLYRDHQLGYPGFEGAGSHPGVDISVPYNTDLFTASKGRVITAHATCNGASSPGCGGGWGNHVLVRVKVSTPSTGGWKYRYLLYAHLKDVYVRAGDRVTRGQRIGKTGNSGNSSGAHLHFQVEKNRSGQSHPWWPAHGDVNRPDTGGLVLYYTESPMVFINNGHPW